MQKTVIFYSLLLLSHFSDSGMSTDYGIWRCTVVPHENCVLNNKISQGNRLITDMDEKYISGSICRVIGNEWKQFLDLLAKTQTLTNSEIEIIKTSVSNINEDVILHFCKALLIYLQFWDKPVWKQRNPSRQLSKWINDVEKGGYSRKPKIQQYGN